MPGRNRSLYTIAALLGFLLLAASARADSAADEARALVLKGNAQFQLGQFKPALDFYRRAYELKPSANTLFNIGQCQRELGEYHKAIFSYRNYLLGAPGAPNRADVEAIIAELEGLLRKQEEAAQKRPSGVLPTTVPAVSLIESRPPDRPEKRSWYRRWYVWAGAGAVVVGAVVGGVVASRGGSSSLHRPATGFGDMQVTLGGGR